MNQGFIQPKSKKIRKLGLNLPYVCEIENNITLQDPLFHIVDFLFQNCGEIPIIIKI